MKTFKKLPKKMWKSFHVKLYTWNLCYDPLFVLASSTGTKKAALPRGGRMIF